GGDRLVCLPGLVDGVRAGGAAAQVAGGEHPVDGGGGLGQIVHAGVADGESANGHLAGVHLPHREHRACLHAGHEHHRGALVQQRQCGVEVVPAAVVPPQIDPLRGGLCDAAVQLGVAVVDHVLCPAAAAPLLVIRGGAGHHACTGVNGDLGHRTAHGSPAAGHEHRLARPQVRPAEQADLGGGCPVQYHRCVLGSHVSGQTVGPLGRDQHVLGKGALPPVHAEAVAPYSISRAQVAHSGSRGYYGAHHVPADDERERRVGRVCPGAHEEIHVVDLAGQHAHHEVGGSGAGHGQRAHFDVFRSAE